MRWIGIISVVINGRGSLGEGRQREDAERGTFMRVCDPFLKPLPVFGWMYRFGRLGVVGRTEERMPGGNIP